ncbi:hypothetical protein [Streptomyces californicus]|uniref:hypothetical protein n=1 Tax=Streptomyces californicus TaxID=67351 RepID=UPI0033CFA903
MGEARKYTSGTHAALMSLCRGVCYWPGCEESVTRFVDGEHILNLEIAHIRAVSSGGKRFDPELSLDEKNSFSNLLLLCKVHHVRVDGHGSEQYTVELLEAWKEQRESEGTAPLLELRGLTQERLRELVSESFASFQDETREALEKLARIAPEAAATFRSWWRSFVIRGCTGSESIQTRRRGCGPLPTAWGICRTPLPCCGEPRVPWGICRTVPPPCTRRPTACAGRRTSPGRCRTAPVSS